MGCVYIITCIPTGKYYVGKTIKKLKNRWTDHKSDAKTGRLGCSYLHNSINKYGVDNFSIDILAESDNDEILKNLERLWISCLDSQNSQLGMNLTGGGDGVSNPSEERRKQMKQVMLGNTFRKGLPAHNKGIPHSENQIKKLKENYWGKRENADEIKKMLRSQANNRK